MEALEALRAWLKLHPLPEVQQVVGVHDKLRGEVHIFEKKYWYVPANTFDYFLSFSLRFRSSKCLSFIISPSRILSLPKRWDISCDISSFCSRLLLFRSQYILVIYHYFKQLMKWPRSQSLPLWVSTALHQPTPILLTCTRRLRRQHPMTQIFSGLIF